MLKVAVTSFTPAVNKSGSFEITEEFSYLARHVEKVICGSGDNLLVSYLRDQNRSNEISDMLNILG